jgi:hypothetical protein
MENQVRLSKQKSQLIVGFSHLKLAFQTITSNLQSVIVEVM